ncbi:MAG: hypothetical protein ACXACO_21520 [Promethearchaeota archaeon]|jgi:hypothetical protein
MQINSKISYLLEVREFRKNLKKIVIPYEEFSIIPKGYNGNNHSSEMVVSNI